MAIKTMTTEALAVLREGYYEHALNKQADKVFGEAYTASMKSYIADMTAKIDALTKASTGMTDSSSAAMAQKEIARLKGNMTDMTGGHEMRLVMHSAREMQSFCLSMQNKGIMSTPMRDRVNGQYVVLMSSGNREQAYDYLSQNNIAVQTYRSYKTTTRGELLSDTRAMVTSSPIMQGARSSEAQREAARIGHTVDALIEYRQSRRKSGKSCTLNAWDDISVAAYSMRNGGRVLTDAKYAKMWGFGNETEARGYTEKMLKSLEKTYGYDFGLSSLGGVLHDVERINGGNPASDAVRKTKRDILTKYSSLGLIKKDGSLDTAKIIAVREGKAGRGLGMTEEEANFLLMNAGNTKGHGLLGASMRGLSNTSRKALMTAINCEFLNDTISAARRIKKIKNTGRAMLRKAKKAPKIIAVPLKIGKSPIGEVGTYSASMYRANAGKPSPHAKRVAKKNARTVKQQTKHAKKVARKEARLDFWRNKTLLGRAKNAVKNSFVGKFVGGLFGGALGFLGAVKKFKTTIIKMFAALCIILLLVSYLITMLGGVAATVSSFFEGKSASVHLFEALTDAEEDWQATLQDWGDIWRDKDKYRYGDDALDLPAYIPQIALENISDNGIVPVVWYEDKIRTNPFPFAPKDMSLLGEPKAFDVNNAWTIETGGNSAHTSNVKEILCMTDVMYFSDIDGSTDVGMGTSAIDMTFTSFWRDVQRLVQRSAFLSSLFFDDNDRELPALASYSNLKAYALTLFSASHQTSLDIEPHIEDRHDSCRSASGFYVANTKGKYAPHIYDTNGVLRDVSDRVTLVQSYDALPCIWDGFTANADTYNEITCGGSSACWAYDTPEEDSVLEYDSNTAVPSSTEDRYSYNPTTEHFVHERIKVKCKKKKKTEMHEVIYILYNEDGTEQTDEDGVVLFETKEEEVEVTYYHITVTHEFDSYTRVCKGHLGTYCGGHLGIKTKGTVYSFTASEALGEVQAGVISNVDYRSAREAQRTGLNIIVGRGADGKWITGEHGKPDLSGLPKRLALAGDIFDIDAAILYGSSTFPCKDNYRAYSGWTSDNMLLAGTKYSQDWISLYGFDPYPNVGNKTLSSSDISSIISAVGMTVNLDAEHEYAIRLALGEVGRATYDSTNEHWAHGYKLEPHNGQVCTKTDSLGFANWLYCTLGVFNRVLAPEEIGAMGVKYWMLSEHMVDCLRPATLVIKDNGETGRVLVCIGMIGRDLTLQTGDKFSAGDVLFVDCMKRDANGGLYLVKEPSWVRTPTSRYICY